jgi:hypothetical protein
MSRCLANPLTTYTVQILLFSWPLLRTGYKAVHYEPDIASGDAENTTDMVLGFQDSLKNFGTSENIRQRTKVVMAWLHELAGPFRDGSINGNPHD